MKKLVFLIALASGAAQAALPKTLVIGYPEEGKVDASIKACTEVVKDVTGWEGDALEDGIAGVCTARRNHVNAYSALQFAYERFSESIAKDNRLMPEDAIQALKNVVKNCIDYRSNLTTGGHNIAIDIIPNEIAADCLKLGADLLDKVSIPYLEAVN